MRLTYIGTILCLAALCLAAVPASASGKIFYGSRVGMQVTIIGVSGIGTAHAKIRVKHLPEDARKFCIEYGHDKSRTCVEQTLRETHLNDTLAGNCVTGAFTSLYGEHLKFAGENKKRGPTDPRYRIVTDSGEVLDGSGASGYGYDLDQFEALCPARAQGDD